MSDTTFNNNNLPTLEEIYAMRLKEEEKNGEKLNTWINLPNNDIRKLLFLYPMLDAHLFYDHLNESDTKRFADELDTMSENIENFSEENINFFKISSDFLHRYSTSSKNIIENEEDLKFNNLVEDFFEYNYNDFKNYEEGVTKKAS